MSDPLNPLSEIEKKAAAFDRLIHYIAQKLPVEAAIKKLAGIPLAEALTDFLIVPRVDWEQPRQNFSATAFEFAPWKPPFDYDRDGSRVIDSKGRWILDVRGWGFLTGKGQEAVGMDEEKAAAIQNALGNHVVKLLNNS